MLLPVCRVVVLHPYCVLVRRRLYKLAFLPLMVKAGTKQGGQGGGLA